MDTDIAGSKLFVALLAAIVLNFSQCSSCLADADLRLPRVVVNSGGPYKSANLNVQKFYDLIQIPDEYLRQPLSMVCTNGSETAPGYSWVRVFLLPDNSDQDFQQSPEPLGRLLVNEDSFLSTSQIYLDLSGQFKHARNRICVEAAGKVGAVYSWEIRSIGKPLIYMPAQASTVSGAWLEIAGAGFSLRPNENSVQLGPVMLPVAESSSQLLRVYIPLEFPAGSYDLSVAIRSYKSRVVKLQVQAPKSQQ